MGYTITRIGSSIKSVDSAGDTILFTAPVITNYATSLYLTRPAPCVEIRQGQRYVQLTVDNTTNINGTTGTAIDTLAKIFDVVTSAISGSIPATTAATGSNWTALTSTTCSQVSIANGTGTSIDVRRGGSGGQVFPLAAGMSHTFTGLTNANQLEVKRTDSTNVQVIVGASYTA